MSYPRFIPIGYKKGDGDYHLNFYLRIINALADNIGIHDDSISIRIRGVLALVNIKVTDIKVHDGKITIYIPDTQA